jgi:hypothetical protein
MGLITTVSIIWCIWSGLVSKFDSEHCQLRLPPKCLLCLLLAFKGRFPSFFCPKVVTTCISTWWWCGTCVIWFHFITYKNVLLCNTRALLCHLCWGTSTCSSIHQLFLLLLKWCVCVCCFCIAWFRWVVQRVSVCVAMLKNASIGVTSRTLVFMKAWCHSVWKFGVSVCVAERREDKWWGMTQSCESCAGPHGLSLYFLSFGCIVCHW